MHQLNSAGLLVHLQRQYNPSVPCVLTEIYLQSHWAPCAFTGMHPQTNPLCISQETARLSLCARQVRGSILRNFCRLVAYLCCVVSLRQWSGRVILNDWLPLRVSTCASVWNRQGPRGLPSPKIFMVLGDMKTAFVRPPPRDLDVRGILIVRCGLSCLVDLNSDLYCLCGSLHGLDTFWARGLR